MLTWQSNKKATQPEQTHLCTVNSGLFWKQDKSSKHRRCKQSAVLCNHSTHLTDCATLHDGGAWGGTVWWLAKSSGRWNISVLNSQSCPRLQCVVLLKHAHSMRSLCHTATHTHTHSVKVCCVGCAATAVALTAMSLCFSKKKKKKATQQMWAEEVTEVSGMSEPSLNQNALTHTKSPVWSVNSCCLLCHTDCRYLTEPNRVNPSPPYTPLSVPRSGQWGLLSLSVSAPDHMFIQLCSSSQRAIVPAALILNPLAQR